MQPLSPPSNVAECLGVLAEALPELRVGRRKLVTAGWDSVVLIVNDETVFRFARRADVVARFNVEIALLPELAPTLPAPIPNFTTVRMESEAPFVAYPLLAGESPSAQRLRGPRVTHRLAHELGAFLAALHRFPVERAASLGVPGVGTTAGWRAEFVEFYDWVREHVVPQLTEGERRRMAAFWEAYLDDNANFAFTPTLIHRDLGPEHILCDLMTGALTGILDWGDVSIGDPALDFAGIYGALGQHFALAALADYPTPVDPSFWFRTAFYAALAPFHTLRFGVADGNDVFVAKGLAELRAWLASKNWPYASAK